MMKRLLLLAVSAGLLVACGGSGGGGGGERPNPVTVAPAAPVSAFDVKAAALVTTAPDEEPVAAATVGSSETDTLNPASGGVTVSLGDAADAEPIAGTQLPVAAPDPEKVNS